VTIEQILELLYGRGLISAPNPAVQVLSGGVSSDIWTVDDGRQKMVVKKALAKLRVADDWFADVSRNRHEQEFIEYVSRFLPDSVPRILHADAEHGFFVMEWLGPEFANWKTMLLEGRASPEHARQAARILAAIHRHSWDDPEARTRFATTPQFYQLRIEPYLITAGERNPNLTALFREEAERLAATSQCLVHGDFSPKNILIGPHRMVLLDCEVAWFGDPAFDVAFLLNHLFLKALHLNATAYVDLAVTAWQAYLSAMPSETHPNIESHVARLLPMLMLARVDGKSPVEYLTSETNRAAIRSFVAQRLRQGQDNLLGLTAAWQKAIIRSP